MKKLVILLAVIISLSSRGQKYMSDSTVICPFIQGTGCKIYPNETKLTFSPSVDPKQVEVYFPRTREKSILLLQPNPQKSIINDSTNMVFYMAQDSQELESIVIVGIKLINGKISAISVQDETSLIVFLIKKENESDNPRIK